MNNYPWVIGVEPEVADPGEQVAFTALLDPPDSEIDSYLWTFGTAEAPWAFNEYENPVLTSEESSPTVHLIDMDDLEALIIPVGQSGACNQYRCLLLRASVFLRREGFAAQESGGVLQEL